MSDYAARPRHLDGVAWSKVRKAWIASSTDKQRTQLRLALAAEVGLTLDTLRAWAQRCGWPGIQRHNGRGR